MKRIGIFGGSFNPIHNGHLHLADLYASELALQEILLVPVYLPPHKSCPDLAPAADRAEMCRLAAGQREYLSLCRLECDAARVSYTWQTLRTLKEQRPGEEFFLLVGSDMFLTLDTWQHPEEIFRLATVCTAARSQGEYARLQAFGGRLERLGCRWRLVNAPPVEISSTLVRSRIRAGQPVTGLVPAPVEEYLRRRRLYEKGERE